MVPVDVHTYIETNEITKDLCQETIAYIMGND